MHSLMFEKRAPEDVSDEQSTKLVAWFEQRRSEIGGEPKKTIAEAAKQHFKSDYRERSFNEAYKRVYQRSRGRPARSKNKQFDVDLFI